MSKMKNKMMEIEESANEAFQDYITGSGEKAANPYSEAMWAEHWDKTFDELVNEYNEHLDRLAEEHRATVLMDGWNGM